MQRDLLRAAMGAIWMWLACGAGAQQYVISTAAGGVPPRSPVAGTAASINVPNGAAVDSAGNFYFATGNCVFRLDAKGMMTRLAGNGRSGYGGDGGPATDAQLGSPSAVALDERGNVYIADYYNYRIRRVSLNGIITTVAGKGWSAYSGDGGPATSAGFDHVTGVAVDKQGNLFVADGSRIRKVSPAGIITTVAGTGKNGYSGDGGPATSAQLDQRTRIAVDGNGNLFIADFWNHRIRKIAPDGIITTVTGNGKEGYSGDGGHAVDAQVRFPGGVMVDGQGNLFIADTGNHSVRKVSLDGLVSTVAGTGNRGYSGDAGSATRAELNSPTAVAVGGDGRLFIAEYDHVRQVSPGGIITTVAGGGRWDAGNGGPAASAQLGSPNTVAVDSKGNLFIGDGGFVRKISPGGIVTPVAGNGTYGYSGDGGPATSAQLEGAAGLAVDSQGSIYIAEYGRVRKVLPDGIITTFAGTGGGNSGGGGFDISTPTGLAVDGQGNLFFTEPYRVRKISPRGIMTTVAGNGSPGYSGDGGPATSARLNRASGVAVDGQGNVFIADWSNNRVRKVSPGGIISTFAGTGVFSSYGDGGPATSAAFWYPQGLAVDAQGTLFIADNGNRRIRRVSPDGVITTIAGNGTCCYSGDGGPAGIARMDQPQAVAVDAQGIVYVADTYNNAIRRLQPSSQAVLVSAVVDAANQSAGPISPGKIVVLYGTGLGPPLLNQNRPVNGMYSTELGGTTVFFNGIAAPLLYTSTTQVAAVVPYGITDANAQVTVSYQGATSPALTLPVAAAAPALFTLNQTGAGQAAAVNAADGLVNTAANPVKIGGYVSLFATGEGRTSPAAADGGLASGSQLPQPVQSVSVTIGGKPAVVQYAGAAPNQVAGLMQVNVQIPSGVEPGGYVPVELKVGGASTTAGAIWIAVAPN